jgi:hypothetical protein
MTTCCESFNDEMLRNLYYILYTLFSGTLDYIFVNGSHIEVIEADITPPGFGEDGWSSESPPNAIWPSDHALVKCSLSIS